MNPRLYAALAAAGKIRSARWAACRRCRAPVITGLDADTAAIQAHCDPTPLDPVGELLAVTQRRTTYDITVSNHRAYLDYRRDAHIQTRPAGTYDVLTDHRCGTPPLPSKPPTPLIAIMKETTSDPPF